MYIRSRVDRGHSYSSPNGPNFKLVNKKERTTDLEWRAHHELLNHSVCVGKGIFDLKAIKKFEPLLGGIRNIKGNNENHGYQGCLLTALDWYLSWFFISSFNRFKLNWITGLVFNGFKNQLNVMVLFGFWFHCVGLYRIESVCKTHY